MKFTTAFTFSTLVAIAAAAKSFGIVTINSGTKYQYNSVLASGSDVTVGSQSENAVGFVLNDDKSLVDANTHKYLSVDSDHNVIESDSPDKSFGIGTDGLTYEEKAQFGVDSNTNKLMAGKSGDNTVSVSLKVMEEKTVANAYPKKNQKHNDIKENQESKKNAPSDKKSTQFGVISINSGGKFHLTGIKKVASHPHVFSVGGSEGSDVTLTLKPDTTLIDQDGRGIFVDPNTGEFGNVAPFGRQAASKGFSIENGDLVYQGKSNWKACPSGDEKYSLANNNCVGGTAIALYAVKPHSI